MNNNAKKLAIAIGFCLSLCVTLAFAIDHFTS